MHELGLAQAMLNVACRRAGGGRILALRVEVGALALVVPDALRFAFECLQPGTAAEGARLDIRVLPGKGTCRECGLEADLHDAWQRCQCGSLEIQWQSGTDIRVVSMEVEECAEPAVAKPATSPTNP